MNIDELKKEIELRAGVPAHLLTGETVEENIAQARALLAFRKQHDGQAQKTPKELFGEWYRATQGIEEVDEAGAALSQIEAAAKAAAGVYPAIRDAGETKVQADGRPVREQFADWMRERMEYNPFVSHDDF